MASLAFGLAGAGIGAAIGGSFLGMSAVSIGWSVGSALGSALFQPDLPDINGPTLSDTSVQSNTYGNMRDIRYGTNRIVCKNIIWATEKIPTEHTETAGGKGGPSQSVTTTTYSVSFAVALGECGPDGIAGVRRIWANKNLILDVSTSNTGITGQSGNIRVYSGAADQMPSALMEAHLGAGNVPAYRGTPYIEFEDFQLEKYGNQMPLIEAEVVDVGDVSDGTTIVLDTSSDYTFMMEHPFIQGKMLAIWKDPGTSEGELHVIDYVDNTIEIIPLYRTEPARLTNPRLMCYVPITNELWIATGWNDTIDMVAAVILDADTYAHTRNVIIDQGVKIWPARYCFTPIYDPTLDAVWFFTNSSTTAEGVEVVDVQSLDYVDGGVPCPGAFFSATHYSIGNGYLVLGSYYGNLLVFSNRQYITSIPTNTAGAYGVEYDPSRNRFFWYYDTGKMRTIDGETLAVAEFTNTLTVTAPGVSISYHAKFDKVFLFGVISATYWLYQLNAETFAVENSWEVGYNIDAYTGVVQLPLTPEYVGWIHGSDKPELFPLVPRLAPDQVTLASIVADLCGRVDLASGDIDVSQLTDAVDGYLIGQQMTARAGIESLQSAYYFDAVESD